jgi:chemotaxis protein CheX
MTDEERAVFATTLTDVCSEMWSGAASSVDPKGLDLSLPIPGMMLAMIGVAGEEFRGALVTLARPDFFRAIYPPELRRGAIGEEQLVDWAGEVSNQLLGRIKNRLCSVGLYFNVSSPTVVRGDALTLSAYTRAAGARHALLVGGERADFFFDLAHDQGKPLLPGTGPIVAATLEGEGVLF